jgi:hypothetical protein
MVESRGSIEPARSETAYVGGRPLTFGTIGMYGWRKDMAYIIGLLSVEEEAELKRRGWEIESAPDVDYDGTATSSCRPNAGMRMAWVDAGMFQIMSGPEWDRGRPELI